MFYPTSSCSIDGMYNLCYMMYLLKLSSPNFKKSPNCYIIIFSEYHRQPAIHLLAICCTVLYSTWLIVAWHGMICPTSSCSIDNMYNLCYTMMYLSKLSSPNFKIISRLLYYNFLRISSSTSHTTPGYLWHCVVFYMVDCCMGL